MLRRPIPHLLRRLAAAGVLLALTAGAAGLGLEPPAGAQTSSELGKLRAREGRLSTQVARLSGLVSRLNSDIALLARRERVLQAALDRQRAELVRTQRALRRQRAQLARLRTELAASRRVLSLRLREMYTADRPDMVTVVLSSRGWVDLLERSEFIQRINEQDRRVVRQVRDARDAAQVATDRLSLLEARQQNLTDIILQQRNEVAATRGELDRRRAGLAQARATMRAALSRVTARRASVERRVESLSARYADAGSLGSSARWAIPWSIVRCESGGRNWPPNHAGASGYYQIIPATWRAFGGRGPAAYLAPKAEQDRVAARIWRAGAGAHNWVCAGR